MDLEETDPLGQVPFDRRPVVDVHEFAGDEPDGQATVIEPIVAQQEEVGVETREAADLDARPLIDQLLEPPLLDAIEVMMADVRRIGEDQIGSTTDQGRIEPGEVSDGHVQAHRTPESGGRIGEGSVKLDASRRTDQSVREHLTQSREERAGTDRWVEESHRTRPIAPEPSDIPSDRDRQRVGSGELSEPIPLVGAFEAVQAVLLRRLRSASTIAIPKHI